MPGPAFGEISDTHKNASTRIAQKPKKQLCDWVSVTRGGDSCNAKTKKARASVRWQHSSLMVIANSKDNADILSDIYKTNLRVNNKRIQFE